VLVFNVYIFEVSKGGFYKKKIVEPCLREETPRACTIMFNVEAFEMSNGVFTKKKS
jgi:hypothetical protein